MTPSSLKAGITTERSIASLVIAFFLPIVRAKNYFNKNENKDKVYDNLNNDSKDNTLPFKSPLMAFLQVL
jgi:hypothetical protein